MDTRLVLVLVLIVVLPFTDRRLGTAAVEAAAAVAVLVYDHHRGTATPQFLVTDRQNERHLL